MYFHTTRFSVWDESDARITEHLLDESGITRVDFLKKVFDLFAGV